jgi:two-component system chemotaxis response regulator CheY
MGGEQGIRTALVVDDDPTMRAVLRHLLELEGWQVEEAAGGEPAWRLYRECHPDLVLTDLEMPRMSGEGLARKLREEAHAEVPVVAISRRAPKEGAHDLFDEVLRKPVTRDQVLRWLTR